MTVFMKRARKKYSRYDFGFGLASLFFFVLLPVTVCYFNPDDSVLPPWHLARLGLAVSVLLIGCYCAMVFLFGLPEGAKKFFAAAALIVFIMTFLLPSAAGVIDGLKKQVDLNMQTFVDLVKHLAVWAAVLFFVYNRKTAQIARGALMGCGLFGLAFTAYVCVHGAFFGIETKKLLWETFAADQRDMAAFEELATRQNVIIILWDALEGKIAEEVFDEQRQARDSYSGFTFFPNAVSSAPMTWRSLPILYSGRFQMFYSTGLDTIRKIMATDSFFRDAKDQGFRVACKGLMPTISIGGCESFDRFTGSPDGMQDSPLAQYLFFLNAAQKRVTPVIAHRLYSPLINLVRSRTERYDKKNKTKHLRRKNLARHLQKTIAIERLRTGAFPKKLIYYHSDLPHEPYVSEAGVGYSRRHAKSVFAYALTQATPKIFARLKELGIYDSSLIFVIADHGARSPETSVGIRVGNSPLDLSHTGISRYPAGAYNPLLMVKQPFATGLMKISAAPAMLQDIRSVIAAYVQGEPLDGALLFNLDATSKRDIKLILTVSPETGKTLDTHTFTSFTGSLQDIPEQLSAGNQP